jgi:hypothetical protein
MDKYGMNIFIGESGESLGYVERNTLADCETIIRFELSIENAVELYYTSTNEPFKNYCGETILTDENGFCSIK